MSDVQTIILCVITAAAAGALVGVLITVSLAAKLFKHWLPDFPELLVINSLNLTTTIKDDDEELSSTTGVTWRAAEVTSKFVEHWLDQRSLVMAPKGKDFAIPVKKDGS